MDSNNSEEVKQTNNLNQMRPIEEVNENHNLTSAQLIRGSIGALVGALIGASVWAAVSILTDYEIGYLAILIGILAGFGAKILATPGSGIPLQFSASLAALIGLIIGKYAAVAYIIKEEYKYSYFSSETFTLIQNNIGTLVKFYDLIWILVAIVAAWGIPRQKI